MQVRTTLFILSFLINNLCLAQSLFNVPDDFELIQEAIDAAQNGDTILVAPGTYIENLSFQGKNILLGSHFLSTEDEVFIDQTIIDGSLSGPVISFEQGETQEAQLVGFQIINGTHDLSQDFPPYGGGIVCVGASPHIRNNHISNIEGSAFGYSNFGGVYCEDSEAIIESNRIQFIQGHFTQKLGGIVSHKASPMIIGNHIQGISGGYVFQGGGISADSSDLFIYRNVIDSCHFDVGPINASIRLFNSEATIQNNTLIGELTLNQENTVNLVNNIILASTEANALTELFESNANITANYNNINGGWAGSGNFDADPLFVDFENRDFQLQSISPCIDLGDPASDPDLDGTRADIGAFYFHQNSTSNTEKVWHLEVSIYPNPGSELIFVEWNQTDISEVKFQLFDTNGKVIKSGAILNQASIDINTLPLGTYWLELSHPNEGFLSSKVLKIK